jgi:sugar lactone lactonase YvrE
MRGHILAAPQQQNGIPEKGEVSFLWRLAMWRKSPTGSTLAVMVVMVALAGEPAATQSPASGDPLPNPFRSVENYLKLPNDRKIGSIVGIRFDRDDASIWMADRCGANTCVGSTLDPILKFDSSGKFVKGFGAGMLVFPHGLFVDGDGNIWVTDNGGRGSNNQGHQVFKFNPDGKVLMTLGTPGIAGDGPATFNQPSDVVIASNGDIFVADGHGGATNHRIVKFSKDGTFMKTWGKKGSEPGEFDTPHAMVIDSRDRIFVADRGNKRIQIFDKDGKFLAAWKQFGDPSGLFIDENDILYASGTSERGADGVSIGSVKDGRVTGFIPKGDGVIVTVAVNAKGVLYAVAGVSGSRPNVAPLRIFVKK